MKNSFSRAQKQPYRYQTYIISNANITYFFTLRKISDRLLHSFTININLHQPMIHIHI